MISRLGIELTKNQARALASLARDPYQWVPAATLGKLRKMGLAGKEVTRQCDGRQKTISPVTDAGKQWLAAEVAP